MSDNTGTIAQVIGPVVDADFSKAGNLPKIYNALEIEYEVYGKPTKLVLKFNNTLETDGFELLRCHHQRDSSVVWILKTQVLPFLYQLEMKF